MPGFGNTQMVPNYKHGSEGTALSYGDSEGHKGLRGNPMECHVQRIHWEKELKIETVSCL